MSKNPHYFEIIKREFGLTIPLCAVSLGLQAHPGVLSQLMHAFHNGKIGTPENLLHGAAMLMGQPESDAIAYHKLWLERHGWHTFKKNQPYNILEENIFIKYGKAVLLICGVGKVNGSLTRSFRVNIVKYIGVDKDVQLEKIEDNRVVPKAAIDFLEGK